MGPEGALFGGLMLLLLGGIVVKEIMINEERELFDKSDVKYTDGDNT